MLARNIAVTKQLFRLDEKKQLLAHTDIASFDWDFARGDVQLVCGDENLAVQQIGSGNHEGRVVVVLHPYGSWDDATAYVERMQTKTEKILIRRSALGAACD